MLLRFGSLPVTGRDNQVAWGDIAMQQFDFEVHKFEVVEELCSNAGFQIRRCEPSAHGGHPKHAVDVLLFLNARHVLAPLRVLVDSFFSAGSRFYARYRAVRFVPMTNLEHLTIWQLIDDSRSSNANTTLNVVLA
eukprot:TRINITY_DN12526_c0_g5_i1.p1 TRINITY_DN12526_c0_g5~~TRINITY_DN12526_c0_g5_i1.p1  ORF type:complete len:135 (+),score=19.37 TRINITY_DN12526_c0_g5_i1:158-562(+)